MSDDLFSLDSFVALKKEGISAQEALDIAVKQGLGEILLIRMLRGVYELSLSDAFQMVKQY